MPAAHKGSKTPLSHPVYTVHVELPADLRHLVDIAAVLLAGDGRVRSDDDLVFFNNPSRAGVTLRPDGTLQVDLSQVPSEVERVLVTGSTEAQGKTFGDIPAMTIRVDGPRQRIQFTPPGLSVESVLQMVAFYRRDGAWKLDAIGQGYSEGLAAFATAHGIEVDDPGHPEPIIPATPITPGPSPINMTKVRIVLDKSSPTKTAQIDLRKSRGETGWVLTVGLEWDGRGARYGPAGQVTRYGEGDLDVYFFCRNEQTDDFVIISGEPGHQGSLSTWPFIEHGGDSTQPGQNGKPAAEQVHVHPNENGDLLVNVYQSIDNGAGAINTFGRPRLAIRYGRAGRDGQPGPDADEILIRPGNGRNSYSCVPQFR